MREKKKKHLIKENFFLKKDKLMPTIVNVPLDPKTGRPLFRREEVEERKIIRKGQHTQFRALLKDDKDRYYVRLTVI